MIKGNYRIVPEEIYRKLQSGEKLKASERNQIVRMRLTPPGPSRITEEPKKGKRKSVKKAPAKRKRKGTPRKEEKLAAIRADQLGKFAIKFYKIQKAQHPRLVRNVNEAKFQSSCDVLDKLIRLDKYTWEEIQAAILWAVDDDFWSTNLLSLTALRKRGRNGESKFTNVLVSYERSRKRNVKRAAELKPTKPAHKSDALSHLLRSYKTISGEKCLDEHKLYECLEGLRAYWRELPGTSKRAETSPAILPNGRPNPDARYSVKYMYGSWQCFLTTYTNFLEDRYKNAPLSYHVGLFSVEGKAWARFLQIERNRLGVDMKTGQTI